MQLTRYRNYGGVRKPSMRHLATYFPKQIPTPYLISNPLHANSPMYKASHAKIQLRSYKNANIKQKDRAANENDATNVFAFGCVIRWKTKNKHWSKGGHKT